MATNYEDFEDFISNINESFCFVYGVTPYEINCGLCEEWAIQAERFSDEIYVYDLGIDSDYGGHVFVEYHGRYYDAECLEGVEDYRNLPIFQQRA